VLRRACAPADYYGGIGTDEVGDEDEREKKEKRKEMIVEVMARRLEEWVLEMKYGVL